MDIPRLEAVVPVAVRMLDNAIDPSRFSDGAERKALAKRRIGLGVTGLSRCPGYVRQPFGSAQAVHVTRDWTRCRGTSHGVDQACRRKCVPSTSPNKLFAINT